jgi:hypothetical protein
MMPQAPFWSVPLSDLTGELGTSARGLSPEEARRRVEAARGARLRPTRATRGPRLFLHQFQNLIAVILISAGILAFFLGDPADAAVIVGIVIVSGALGFWHERKTVHAVAQLLALVRTTATVRRDGAEQEVSPEEVVHGDIVLLSPGDHVPGDGRLLSSNDLFIDEAALTGESFPVPKADAVVAAEAPLAQRTNAVFLGTHVVSGNGAVVIVYTGRATAFGAIAERLRLRPPETAFEQGVRRFGYGHQREFRQHVQHGGSVAPPALPAATPLADPAHEPAHRPAGDDDCQRPRRRGDGRVPPALGPPLHSALHARLWAHELRLRLPDVCRPPLGDGRARAPVPDGLVRRVRGLRRPHRARRSHAPPAPSESTGTVARGDFARRGRGGPRPALCPWRRVARIPAPAAALLPHPGRYRRRLHLCRRDRQAVVLPALLGCGPQPVSTWRGVHSARGPANLCARVMG